MLAGCSNAFPHMRDQMIMKGKPAFVVNAGSNLFKLQGRPITEDSFLTLQYDEQPSKEI